MKFRIYDNGTVDVSPVISYSKIICNEVLKKKVNSVHIEYSKELTKTGPLYGDFIIE